MLTLHLCYCPKIIGSYMKKIILFGFASLLTFATTAQAQIKDSSYKDWAVYIMKMQGRKTCYIASFPTAKSGNYKKRDEPYFMVTYLGENVSEVSASSGYKYQDGSNVSVELGNKKLTMFTSGEIAWAKDRVTDSDFINTMKKQNSMRVKGSSEKSSYSIDKYSLNGFTDAYNRMKEACK